MKKILISVMTLVLVLGLVGAGAFAYFSDVETSTDNTFTAGTLDLKVNGENPWTSPVVTLGPLQPGGPTLTAASFTVKNIGDLGGNLYMRIPGFTDSGGAATWRVPWGMPWEGLWFSSEPEYVAERVLLGRTDNISTKIKLFAGYGANGNTPITGIDTAMLGNLPGYGWKFVQSLAPKAFTKVKIGGTLVHTAENEYQGDVSTFTIEFALVQTGQTPA